MPDALTHDAVLIQGPQDGARVRVPIPHVAYLHVGRRWLGDGYAAWSREPSKRFPARYVWDGHGNLYHFDRWIDAPDELTPTEPCRG